MLIPFFKRSDVYTAAAEAVMYATHRTKAKKQSATLQGLLDRLLILAHDKMNPRAQMYALRVSLTIQKGS